MLAVVNRKAVGGNADCGLQRGRQAERAVIGDQLRPGIDSARHRHGMGRFALDRCDALFLIPADSGSLWGAARSGQQRRQKGPRAARSVEGDDVFAFRRIEAETIAADAGRMRLDHALHGAGGDRRIHRVAALLQNGDGGDGRERMRGRRHAIGGKHGGASGPVEFTHTEISFRKRNCPSGRDKRTRSYRRAGSGRICPWDNRSG